MEGAPQRSVQNAFFSSTGRHIPLTAQYFIIALSQQTSIYIKHNIITVNSTGVVLFIGL